MDLWPVARMGIIVVIMECIVFAGTYFCDGVCYLYM